MARRAITSIWLLAIMCCATPALHAQVHLSQQPPLLYVKLIGPKGAHATFFRGAADGQAFELPCTIGVRPGYSIRLAITGIPAYPSSAFFPTLHVHGSLFLANNQRNAEYPAALVFRDEDFARVKAVTTLKKIVVLERPDSAIPAATSPDAPFEIAVPAQQDPLREAQERGQPLLIMQMGERRVHARRTLQCFRHGAFAGR